MILWFTICKREKWTVNDFSIYVISNRRLLAEKVIECLSNFGVKYFDGSNVKSFSELVNRCVSECSTETIIICSDKVRPNDEHVNKLLKLLNDGYGFVGLYRFAFFGFKKELFRRIGCMDERYIGGNFEDCDIVRRLSESDIAYYESEEVPCVKLKSSWSKKESHKHFENKWRIIDNLSVKRMLSEEVYDYDFGPTMNIDYLSWEHTVLCEVSDGFKDVKII